jgi:hypothetical protein
VNVEEGSSGVVFSKVMGVEYAPHALVGLLFLAALLVAVSHNRLWTTRPALKGYGLCDSPLQAKKRRIGKRFGAPIYRNDTSE